MYELYQSMPEKIKEEVWELIASKYDENMDARQLATLADESFGDIWNDPANDHWDEFFAKEE